MKTIVDTTDEEYDDMLKDCIAYCPIGRWTNRIAKLIRR